MTSAAARALCLGVLVTSCTPALSDGAYSCDDHRCPPGWYCWSDRLCRVRAEPSDAARLPDTGPGDPCHGACSTASECVIGQWGPAASPPSYQCAPSIMTPNHGAPCTATPGCSPPDACVHGHCLRPCTSPGDTCGFGEGCFPVMGGLVCAVPCMPPGPTQCMQPAFACNGGVCLPMGF